MKLLVTGATGFLGRAVVDEALRRGHSVSALARRVISTATSSESYSSLRRVEIDLSDTPRVIEVLQGIDVVIHLAASKSGSPEKQMAYTVQATQSLLSAMKAADVDRIIGVSSFSVYDYERLRDGDVLDEQSPLESSPIGRDLYSKAKRMQEDLIRSDANVRWTILRPGAIYGPGNTWTARLGASINDRFWIRIGSSARLPLTYVENCAEAIALAAESESAVGQILNIVDDNPPTQAQYAYALRQRMHRKPKAIVIPWPVMRLIGRCATTANKIILGGQAKLPNILVPSRLAARFKPLRFDNRQIKQMLNWHPRYNLSAGLVRSFEPGLNQAPDLRQRANANFIAFDGASGAIHYITTNGIGNAWVGNELRIVQREGLPFVLHGMRKPYWKFFESSWAADLNQRTRTIYPISPLAMAKSIASAPFCFGSRFWSALSNAIFGKRESFRCRIACLAHFFVACHWARTMCRENISHIHSQWINSSGSIGMYGAWLLNKSFSFTGHAVDLFRDRVALEDKVRRAEFIGCISNWHRELYKKLGARDEQLVIVYCGIDHSHFAPAPQKQKKNDEPYHIRSSGRLVEKKGFEYLIDACKILADRGVNFDCAIAGMGALLEPLRRRIAEYHLSDRVTITGEDIVQENIPEFMHGGDVYCLPCVWASDNDVDGLPQMLMEAMSCGLPAISTRLVGIPDLIIHGETGLLVEPRNAQQVADALMQLKDDPALAQRLALAGRKYCIEKFDIDSSLNPLLERFRRHLDPHQVERSAADRAKPEGNLAGAIESC